jgi:predicted outer membrane repeat protein
LESFSNSRRVLNYAPLAIAIVLSLGRPALAATIVVNSADAVSESGVCTIIDAVTAVNTQTAVNGCSAGDGDDDTIDLTGFTTPATISLTQAVPMTGHALVLSNKVTINGGLSGQTPLVTLQRSTVSGTDSFGLIENSAPLTISGLTLSNGASGEYAGGAILAGDFLTVNYCVIKNNSSDTAGGGIAASAGQVSIMHSTITGNTAGNAGGGIESTVGTQIYYSTVTNNSTLGAAASVNGGGGLFSNAAIHIRDTTFDGNTSASAGGAIYIADVANIVNATISNNTASNGSGGGIFASMAGISVVNSTVTANQASGNGGGINGGPVNLTNSTITGNTATGIGGGVAVDMLTSSYSTLASNTSTGAGGGANFATGADSQATIFYGNTPDDLATASTAAMTGQYNIVGAPMAATPGDTVSCNPMLAALADNGGPTQTMALQTGSCAIDAASDMPVVSTDQRGYSRPAAASTNADIGAYEAGATDPDVIFVNGFES